MFSFAKLLLFFQNHKFYRRIFLYSANSLTLLTQLSTYTYNLSQMGSSVTTPFIRARVMFVNIIYPLKPLHQIIKLARYLHNGL